MATITEILAKGSCLLESPPNNISTSDLTNVLRTRLERCYATSSLDNPLSISASLDILQSTTASESLSIIEQVHSVLTIDSSVGTRDMAQIRTLISIIFQWGISPLLQSVSSAWPSKPVSSSPAAIIDLTDTPTNYSLLTSLTNRLVELLLPDGVRGSIRQTFITSTLINRHLSDLFSVCITLGWLPRSISTASIPTIDSLRPLTMRLLATFSPSENILALGQVLSLGPLISSHTRKTCSSLLSRQLQRPEGVRGFFAAMFGEGMDSTDAPLDKLERVSNLLTTPPTATNPEDYFNSILPRVVTLCSPHESPAYQRASAFAISHALNNPSHQNLSSSIILRAFHSPLTEPIPSHIPDYNSPQQSIDQLVTFATNGDPSPVLVSSVLGPVVPTLYNLYEFLSSNKTSDPALKETVKHLLTTWGKLVDFDRGINILWAIIEDGEPQLSWTFDHDLHLLLSSSTTKQEAPSLVLSSELDENVDLSTNILNLYPSPVPFATLLQSIGRKDLASEIFLQLLQTYYYISKTRGNSNPMRSLLILQLIMQMQQQLEGEQQSAILSQPEKLLTFIKLALDSAAVPRQPMPRPTETSVGLDRLKIVPDAEHENDSDADSDDDDPHSDPYSTDDEMTETALNLLLSILEVHKQLPAAGLTLLKELLGITNNFVSHGSLSIQALAREAQMTITVRIASSGYSPEPSSSSTGGDTQAAYQKALGMLQDPLLPVRAHGIFLLRQIVSPASGVSGTTRALLPAITAIFLQAIQDSDSYMFLNATQGLAAMVDLYGKEALASLLNEYHKSLDNPSVSLTEQELDMKLRIAEAFGMVIRRCGETLGQYVDLFAPTLLQVIRMRHVPTTLRTSAISLLGECANTYCIALSRYQDELLSTMFDLLQVEGPTANKENTPNFDLDPTSTNPKFPSLRRAALYLITLLFREATEPSHDLNLTTGIDISLIRRGKITLDYVSSFDADATVRVMAREGKEVIGTFEKSLLGI